MTDFPNDQATMDNECVCKYCGNYLTIEEVETDYICDECIKRGVDK